MSVIFMDGFDAYASSADLAFKYQISGASLNTSGGRYGGGALVTAGFSANYNYFALVTQPTEVWVGFAFNLTSSGGIQNNALCEFVSTIGEELAIRYNQLTAVFTVIDPVHNTILGTSNSLLITSGEWHWIDIRYKAHSSAGIVEIWIDNNRIANITGINTLAGSGGTGVSVFGWGRVSEVALHMSVDDIVVIDPNSGTSNTGRVGDSRICTTVPASDVTPNDGTPSTSGPHFAMVNEANWSSTNNITMTNTPGQEEQFSVTPLPVHPASIAAVQVLAICEKTDAGTANAKLSVNSSGTVASSASIGVLSPYNLICSIFEHDPHVSAAWTEATVDAVEIGYTVQ